MMLRSQVRRIKQIEVYGMKTVALYLFLRLWQIRQYLCQQLQLNRQASKDHPSKTEMTKRKLFLGLRFKLSKSHQVGHRNL